MRIKAFTTCSNSNSVILAGLVFRTERVSKKAIKDYKAEFRSSAIKLKTKQGYRTACATRNLSIETTIGAQDPGNLIEFTE